MIPSPLQRSSHHHGLSLVGREDERVNDCKLMTSMEEGLPVGKVEKRHARPSKFAVEILARAPVVTSETSKQCRVSSDCPELCQSKRQAKYHTQAAAHALSKQQVCHVLETDA